MVWHGMVWSGYQTLGWRGCDGAPTDLKVVVALPSCNLPPLRTHSPHRSLGPLLPSFKQSFSISSFDFCVYDLNQQLVKRKTCPDIFFWQSDFTLTNRVAESKIKRPIASNTFFLHITKLLTEHLLCSMLGVFNKLKSVQYKTKSFPESCLGKSVKSITQ